MPHSISSISIENIVDDPASRNMKIRLNEQERYHLLKKIPDPHVTFANTSYTYAVQTAIAHFQFENTLQMQKIDDRQDRSAALEKMQKLEEWGNTLHNLSARFKILDAFINNRGPNPQETLIDLILVIQQVRAELESDIDILINKENKPSKKKVLQHLKDEFEEEFTYFTNQCNTLLQKPEKHQIDKLLCVIDRDPSIHALGGFMGKQMTHLLNAGIRMSYKINQRRIRESLRVSDPISHLSDAKHLILIKGQSVIGGPIEHNTYAAIPKAMLDHTTDIEPTVDLSSCLNHDEMKCLQSRVLNAHTSKKNELTSDRYKTLIKIHLLGKAYQETRFTKNQIEAIITFLDEPIQVDAQEEESKSENGDIESLKQQLQGAMASISEENPTKILSLNPYITQWHPAKVDQLLCVITGENAHHNNRDWLYYLFVQPMKLPSSMVEIIFSIPRLIVVLVLGVLEAVLSPFDSEKKHDDKWTSYFHHRLDQFYHDFDGIVAPFNALKKSAWNQYQRSSQATEKELKHQIILNQCADYSGFIHKAFVDFTPQLIAKNIEDFFQSMVIQIVNVPKEIYYLMSSGQVAEETYLLVKNRNTQAKNLYNRIHQNDNQTGNNTYPEIQHCSTNRISTPLDVFYEIMVTLTNDLVNPMYRKYPAVATFFFGFSMTTLGTYLLPISALAWMKPVVAGLQCVAEKISLNLTGQSTFGGLKQPILTSFFIWQLGCMPTQLLIELAHGRFEVLDSLFENAEKVMLGLVTLVGLGIGLQHIPSLPSFIVISKDIRIPNPYFMLINAFSEEAKSCLQGTTGLTSLVLAILGGKAALMAYSMLSGSVHSKPLNGIEELILSRPESKLTILPQSTDDQQKLQAALNKIQEAIQLTRDPNTPLIFKTFGFGLVQEANLYYDYLDTCFNEYNQLLATSYQNQPEYHQLYLDKAMYLDVFYNHYCYQSSNNFLRSLSMFAYPLTLAWRFIKYVMAIVMNKASIKHQIVKSFAKDLVILAQLVAPIARMMADFNMYLSGIFRFIGFLCAGFIALMSYPIYRAIYSRIQSTEITSFDDWIEEIDDHLVQYIALHKTPELYFFRQLLATAARIAGISDNLMDASDKMERDCQNICSFFNKKNSDNRDRTPNSPLLLRESFIHS